ncbi:hypothetical protein V500_03885, partial [Pseudogymnoascus sp. VKM F-4518 (FW-2643)]
MATYNPEWLEFEKALGIRPVLSGSIEDMVGQYGTIVALAKSQLPAQDPSVTTTDHKVKDGVTVRVYQPKGSRAGGKLPVCLYSHGGGWCLGDLEAEDPLCRAISQFSPCIVVSINYRLGPKNKMPTMIDDCMAAWEWAWNAASELGGDQTRYFTAGGSAGGGLSFGIAERLIADGKRSQIAGIVAMVPATLHHSNIPEEYVSSYTAINGNVEDTPVINRKTMETFYHAIDSDPADPIQFPALSKNLASFPPTYIATCEFDPLCGDGKVMELALKKAGVKVWSDYYDGYPHYFWIFSCLSDSKRREMGATQLPLAINCGCDTGSRLTVSKSTSTVLPKIASGGSVSKTA